MMGDTVRSKPWLGLLGNISASMATAAAFGFAMYMKVEFIGINLAAPFLMIGEILTCIVANETEIGEQVQRIGKNRAISSNFSTCGNAGDISNYLLIFYTLHTIF